MASTIRSARLDFSEDRLWPTKPLAGPPEERTQPSTYEIGGMGKELLAEIKLLAELEKACGGQTKSEAQPTTTKLTDSDAEFRPVASNNKQPSLRKRAALGLARALIIFSMGVTATLAWQSWGTLRCLGCSVSLGLRPLSASGAAPLSRSPRRRAALSMGVWRGRAPWRTRQQIIGSADRQKNGRKI